MRRADRLFEIILLLGRSRIITARELGERLEVSERTIYRDIQDLCANGVPIDGEAGVGYRLNRGYQVPPMMFNTEELQALMFGAAVTRSWGDPALADAADRILAKVHAVLPENLRHGMETSHLVVPRLKYTRASGEMLGVLRQAVNDRRYLNIDYRDAEDADTFRTVRPLVLLYWGNTWTLGAWCELRSDFRTFRVDRIVRHEVLDRCYPDEPGRRLNDYLPRAGKST